MTAPRTFMDEMDDQEKARQRRLAESIGLSVRTPSSPEPTAAPEPLDIPSAKAALARRLQLGGKIGPGAPRIGGEIETDSGTYGGEFSEDELQAYLAAARDLSNAEDRAAMAPALQRLRALAAQRPDASTVRKP